MAEGVRQSRVQPSPLPLTRGLVPRSRCPVTGALAGPVWFAVPASCRSVQGQTWSWKTGQGVGLQVSKPPAHPSPVTSPSAHPCPRGLLLAGTGVPSGLGGLDSGGSSGWRSLCSGADSSSSGGGLAGSFCCSGVGMRRKEGRERRCEELRERSTRLHGTETSRRDTGRRACREGSTEYYGLASRFWSVWLQTLPGALTSLQMPWASPPALPAASSPSPGSASAGS